MSSVVITIPEKSLFSHVFLFDSVTLGKTKLIAIELSKCQDFLDHL